MAKSLQTRTSIDSHSRPREVRRTETPDLTWHVQGSEFAQARVASFHHELKSLKEYTFGESKPMLETLVEAPTRTVSLGNVFIAGRSTAWLLCNLRQLPEGTSHHHCEAHSWHMQQGSQILRLKPCPLPRPGTTSCEQRGTGPSKECKTLQRLHPASMAPHPQLFAFS